MSAGTRETIALWLTAAAGYPERRRGSLGASNKTEPYEAGGALAVLHAVLTGTLTGVVKIFASNDWVKNHPTDKWNGQWEDITARVSPAIVNPAGAAASYLVDLQGIRAKAYYFDVAYTSGAGEGRVTWISPLP